MKKMIVSALLAITLVFTLAGCGEKQNTAALKAYKEQMSTIFSNLETIDKEINAIDPESETALDSLMTEFNKLEGEFKTLSETSAPSDLVYYESINALSKEGYDYMKLANEYLKESFSESSYNENVLEASMESYRRANKRVQYIISLIQGIVPEDAS